MGCSMPVPKRKHSLGRVRRKRQEKMRKSAVIAVQDKKSGTYHRPHVEEKVKI